MDFVIMRNSFVSFCAFFILAVAQAQSDTFPVPKYDPNQLFYLQRTQNTNTIVYELQYNNGILNEEEPVNVYWLRYAEKGQREGLSFIQRKFAYGIKVKFLSKDKYQVQSVAYKKLIMHLMKGDSGMYHIYVTINQRPSVLSRIFIKINGGSFWSPNIEYIELRGIDTVTGKELIERRKV
ncbi:MAG: DUF4833 domain-containing protein [Flavitalea sp.]